MKTIKVNLKKYSYNIVIGSNIIARIGKTKIVKNVPLEVIKLALKKRT